MGVTRLAPGFFQQPHSSGKDAAIVQWSSYFSPLFLSRRETRRSHQCLSLFASLRFIGNNSKYNCTNCLHSTLFVVNRLIINDLWSVDTICTYLHFVCTYLHFVCTHLHFVCTHLHFVCTRLHVYTLIYTHLHLSAQLPASIYFSTSLSAQTY